SAVDRVVVLGPAGIIADGAPDEVLAAQGERLAAAGVWLPTDPLAQAPRTAETSPVGPRPADSGPGIPVGAHTAPLLSARSLSVGRGKRAAVSTGIDFALAPGTALAVTGPNGAGKSTLALTAAGLLAPIGGELVAGEALSDGIGPAPHLWRSRQLLRRIGTVFQSPEHQFLTASVRQELELGPLALKSPAGEASSAAEALAERLGLTHLLRAHPFSLSGGEKRRLSVATVLAASPQLIVLDEPTFGQDARTWRELVALLREQLTAGRAILAVTHDREVVETLCSAELRMTAAAPADRDEAVR
ncbi:MAG: ABC transporter ATP-binding protein, partial [Naasia sp.]